MNASVNLTNLRDMTGGDTDMEHELFRVYLHSSDECLEFLRTSCSADASEAWKRYAHAWKGISLNLGAEQLGQLCRIAQDSSGAPVEEKLQMLAEIQKEYEQVRLYLQTLCT